MQYLLTINVSLNNELIQILIFDIFKLKYLNFKYHIVNICISLNETRFS